MSYLDPAFLASMAFVIMLIIAARYEGRAISAERQCSELQRKLEQKEKEGL